MKSISFMPRGLQGFLVLGMTYLYWSTSLIYFFVLFLIAAFLFFFMRRNRVAQRDTLKIEGEIYLAPIHGRVESIRLNTLNSFFGGICHEVRISQSLWKEKGLYLPTHGEVSFLKAQKGKKISRLASNEDFYGAGEELAHTDLNFISKKNNSSLMRFIDCRWGMKPSMWLKSGDRGRAGACFGYYPLGGTLIIYLPDSSDILVYEKERVRPGHSVIAALKDINKV
jgi:hypothetical protein